MAIKLHKESEMYIKEIFTDYKEVDTYTPHKGRTIIHLYPKEDTRDLETGQLNGYVDALFAEAHIYNLTDSAVYKTRVVDSVDFSGIDGNRIGIRIFKDGSTMIIIDEPYVELVIATSLSVYKKKVT